MLLLHGIGQGKLKNNLMVFTLCINVEMVRVKTKSKKESIFHEKILKVNEFIFVFL